MEVRRVVTSFLLHDGRVLILKRSGRVGSYRGRWAGVSGYLEEGEEPFKRALKEVEEETGLDEERVKLVCVGEPLFARDEDKKSVVWIVHPFLFETSSRRLRFDWESIDYRWIKPEELSCYRTVPMLKEALMRVLPLHEARFDSVVKKRLEMIKEDRVHGASWLAVQAVEALKEASLGFEEGSSEEFLDHLKDAAKLLMAARPSMASLVNLIGRMLFRVLKRSKSMVEVEALKRIVVEEAERVVAEAAEAFRSVIRHASNLISDEASIMTHSYSSTVVEALKQAFKEEKRLDVYVTESRPLFEGRRVAAELSGESIHVTLIADAASTWFMKDMDMVLVGADSVLVDGSLINKVGTYSLALAAEEYRVPFYAACEKQKFDIKSLLGLKPVLEEKDSSELISPEIPSKVKARNIYFDITPAKHITGVVTEDGILKPSEVYSSLEEVFEGVYIP